MLNFLEDQNQSWGDGSASEGLALFHGDLSSNPRTGAQVCTPIMEFKSQYWCLREWG